MNTKSLRTVALLPALAILLVLPTRSRADETSAAAEANLAEVKGDAAKLALKELDREIDQVDALIDNAPTPEDKAAAKARIAVLKERRSALRKSYVSARYDELKADVRTEANRLSAWTKRTFTKDPASKAADEAKDAVKDAKQAAKEAGNRAYSAAATAGTEVDLAFYKARPTDLNKDEAKAALKAVDQKIDRLEDLADKMPKGPDRDIILGRVKALEDRKDALEDHFDKTRLNALIDDVQSEWAKFRG